MIAEALTALALIAPAHAREGCNTQACEHRVIRKGMRRTIRPYRAWLRRTAQCESGGDYTTNTGNGFYGGLQFTLQSWHGVGGKGYPHTATILEQQYRAVLLLHQQGRNAWPVCG